MIIKPDVQIVEPENLIADSYPTLAITQCEVNANQGVLERGTLIECDGSNASGAPVGAALSKEKTYFVLADPIDTEIEDNTRAVVYRSGTFYRDGLKVNNEYELTDADKAILRPLNIFVKDGLDWIDRRAVKEAE